MESRVKNAEAIFWSIYGRHAWDKQAESWRQAQTDHIVRLLTEAFPLNPGNRVLDAGCGTGLHALPLAQAGFNVTGIDFAAGMLERAYPKQAKGPDGRLRFVQADLDSQLPFGQASFDAVVCISVLQGVAEPNSTLAEFARVLADDGKLVLVVPRAQDKSLRAMVRERTELLPGSAWLSKLMVVVKSLGEKLRPKSTWTAASLSALVTGAGFNVLHKDDDYQLCLVASRVLQTPVE